MSSSRRASTQKQSGVDLAATCSASAEQPETEEGVQYEFAQVTQRHENRHEITYELTLRQQPKHSRMCGVGEKGNVQRADRRPVDPPPIIQLKVRDPTLPESEANWFLQNPYYFMYASLAMPDSPEELHMLKDGLTRATTGSVVSSLHHLKDVDNADAGFFVFPDLSVRIEGTYRLKFSLFEIVGKEVFHCKYIYSEPFTVYSAKRFPGMEESTFLSRSFADQGLKIRIRKEIRIRRRFPKRKGSGQQEAEETEPKRPRQRRRGEDDDDDDGGNGSDSGGSRKTSPVPEIPSNSEDEVRRTYDVPYPYGDPYNGSDPWCGRPPPTRAGNPYPPLGYYYPSPVGAYREAYSRQGPHFPPQRPPFSYGVPLYRYGRYADPTMEPAFSYGHPPQRPWIPGGRPEPPENVQKSPRPSNSQTISMSGMPDPCNPAGPSPVRPPEPHVTLPGYYNEHRGPAYPRDESSASSPGGRVTGLGTYPPYRGYYPYPPPPWYDPYAPYYAARGYGYDDVRGWRSPGMGPRFPAVEWQSRSPADAVAWHPQPPTQPAGAAGPAPWPARTGMPPPEVGHAVEWGHAAGRTGMPEPNAPPRNGSSTTPGPS